MVTEVDGRPTPKIIDFGVAKATEFKFTDQSLGDTGAIVGTPAYIVSGAGRHVVDGHRSIRTSDVIRVEPPLALSGRSGFDLEDCLNLDRGAVR
jgi:hypothetical protein